MIGWILWYFRERSDLRKALDGYLGPLPADAPIRRVLESPEIQRQIAEFDRADWTALRKQASFRRASRLAIWAGFLGALVPALGLLPIGALPKGVSDSMNVLRILSTILTSAAIMWLSVRQSGVRWFKARSDAEAARAKVFQAIVGVGVANKEMLPAAFECFTRAHLHWQHRYFTTRGPQHKAAAQKIERFRLVGRALLVISAVLGLIAVAHLAAALGYAFPVLSAVLPSLPVPSPDRWNEGLSAMASSILAFTSERSAMDRDTRNAAYYALAAEELTQVQADDIQKAISAAAQGNAEYVTDFCKRVQKVLDAEHRVWRNEAP